MTLSVLGKGVQLFCLLQRAPTDVRGEAQTRDPRALRDISKGHCLSYSQPVQGRQYSCSYSKGALLCPLLRSASLLPSYPISTFLITHTCTFFTPQAIVWLLTNPNRFARTALYGSCLKKRNCASCCLEDADCFHHTWTKCSRF